MNPLLIPPKLLFRALDDLHTLALAAARLEQVEAALTERADAILAMGERIDGHADAVIEVGRRIVELGEQVDVRAEAILEMGERIGAQGERIEAAAREVADRGAQLTEALPVMERALSMAEPLEGAVERLGRVVDRLPGGARGRTPPAK